MCGVKAMRLGRVLLLVCVGISACAAAPTKSKADVTAAAPPISPPTAREREMLLGAMKGELERSMKELRFKDYEHPYFISYQVKEVDSTALTGKFGAVMHERTDLTRLVYTEVRVGDYSFDNYANIDNEAFRFGGFEADARGPAQVSPDALRGVLWQLTDASYKKALSDYLTKKGGSVYTTEERMVLGSFSREPPQKYRGEVSQPKLDVARWRAVIARQTGRMKQAPGLLDMSMDVNLNNTTRYFVSSEGGDIIDGEVVYAVHISAQARAEDGMSIENGRTFYARTADQLPDEATLEAEVTLILTELEALRTAPVIDPYTGPAIMMPEASGVLFHEAVGHRLEGERQRNEEEGRTFKGRVGKQVIPTFLTVYDDPTRVEWEGRQLNGHYKYDDEGVLAQRAMLIEAGELKGFLKSRTPIEGVEHSNGHGRAQGLSRPIARMSNLIVEAATAKQVPYDELKKELMAETRRQGKPYGLIIKDITGGSTNTSGYGYQAFKGSSRMIYMVNPETGEETLARGAELVGTPLVSINKIVAASKETGIFNGYCGAESGYVPVSTVAPALLTTEVELQRTQTKTERSPLLLPPWAAP